MFTFLPALAVQIAYMVVVALAHYAPAHVHTVAEAERYLRFLNMLFSVHFGLLATWWSSRRIDGTGTEAGKKQRTPKSDAHQRDEDTSLIGWLLGPLEPERKRPVVVAKPEVADTLAPSTDEGEPKSEH